MLEGYEQAPPHLVDERQRSMLLMQLGDHHALRLERAEAEAWYLKSLEIDERRATEAPEDVRRQDDLGITLGRVAALQADSGRLEEAEGTWRRTLEVHQRLADAFPDDVRRRDVLHRTIRGLAETVMVRGDLPEAERLLVASLKVVEREVAADPDSTPWRMAAPQTEALLGRLRQAEAQRTDEPARRRELLREAATRYARALDQYAALVVETSTPRWVDFAIRDLESRKTAVDVALAADGG